MNGSKLIKVNKENDLGVTIDEDLKSSKHYTKVAKKKKKKSISYLAAPEEALSSS